MVAGLIALTVLLPASAAADVGFKDQHFAANGTEVTGAKTESKLAFAHGTWWAVMFDEVTADNYIYRLQPGTQTWLKTPAVADMRSNTRSDVLFDGDHLYVASHGFSATASPGFDARLYRYSWQDGGWSLDLGFPVVINNHRTESLVIEKDSTGALWATWVQDQQVYLNRTTGDDRSWGAPFG